MAETGHYERTTFVDEAARWRAALGPLTRRRGQTHTQNQENEHG